MKRYFLFSVLFVFFYQVSDAQTLKNNFKLKGTINGSDSDLIYLAYTNQKDERITDSTKVSNGQFLFEGNVSGPVMAYLYLKKGGRNENSVSFFIEPVSMSVDLKLNDFKNAIISGSKTQNEYSELTSEKQKVTNRWTIVMDTLTAVNKRSNFEYQELKNWVLTPYNAEMDELDFAFFKKYPKSPATAFILRFYVSRLSLDSLRMYYSRLGEKVQQSPMGREIEAEIQKLKQGSPGSLAANFTTTDINGKSLSLSDYKGKYVLLDFWASWCVPCRKGNPHLKELYTKYKDKGFEIIGISDDDRNHDAWRKAVEKDGLPWKHVLRGFDMDKRMKNLPNEKDISEKYGIHSLPTKILIDPKGMIIGRFGEEEAALDKQLESIYK